MAKWPYNTARWQRLRKQHLSLEPLCQDCNGAGVLALATHVDHIHAISNGGHAFPGHDGLASYCTSCHSAKTARGAEAGAVRSTKPRRGCDADGNPIDQSHPWADRKAGANLNRQSLRAGRLGASGGLKTQLVVQPSNRKPEHG